MMKQLAPLKKYLDTAIKIFSVYSFVIFFLVFAAMAGFLVIQIGNLSKLEPTQSELDTKLLEVKTQTKANDDVIEKLEELQDKNVKIESLFDNGRTNPFED